MSWLHNTKQKAKNMNLNFLQKRIILEQFKIAMF